MRRRCLARVQRTVANDGAGLAAKMRHDGIAGAGEHAAVSIGDEFPLRARGNEQRRERRGFRERQGQGRNDSERSERAEEAAAIHAAMLLGIRYSGITRRRMGHDDLRGGASTGDGPGRQTFKRQTRPLAQFPMLAAVRALTQPIDVARVRVVAMMRHDRALAPSPLVHTTRLRNELARQDEIPRPLATR